MNIKNIVAALTVIASTASYAFAPPLVVNGSFEDQQVSTWGIYSSTPGWQGGSFGVELQPNGTVGGVSAFDGRQYVELDTTANSSMWQTLSTQANQPYTLSFGYMPRPDNSAGSASNKVEVWWNNVKVGSFSGKSNGSWVEIELENLIGGAFGSRLEFKAAGISDSFGGFIDHVQVMTAVDEPVTGSMLLCGLGMMGFMSFRRMKHK